MNPKNPEINYKKSRAPTNPIKGLLLGLLFLASVPALPQSGVTGSATVFTQTGPLDCGSHCATVQVSVDVSALTGTDGVLAGINAFVLSFDLDRSGVFAYAQAGASPEMDWFFQHTKAELVDLANRLIMVGAIGDETAPNQLYQLATFTLCGDAGNVVITFDPSQSSLGSRVVNGDGPGPINIAVPPPITVVIPVNFPLILGVGISLFLEDSPEYDLVAPFGPVNILDLVKLINCGAV